MIEELKKLHAQQVDLSDRNIRRVRKDLYMATLHRFGSFENAMKAAKMDYSEFRREHKKGYWTRDKVKELLKQRHAEHKDMSYTAIRNDNETLAERALHFFKTWENVLKAIELDPMEHCRQLPKGYWTKDRLKEEIHRIAASDKDLSARHWFFNYPRIFTAANRVFKHWENALSYCGYDDYSRIRKVRVPYEKVELLDILKDYQKKGIPLDLTTIREIAGAGLVNIIIRRFGSYRNAIERLGLDYDEIRKDAYTEKFLGSFFERAVKEAFESMNMGYEYQPTVWVYDGRIRPDFINRNENVWYDAKLSSWSWGIRKTIENYLPHAERLIIIYLSGNPRENDEYVEYRQIDYYYNQLQKAGGHNLIDQFEMMKKRILRPDMQRKLDRYLASKMQDL